MSRTRGEREERTVSVLGINGYKDCAEMWFIVCKNLQQRLYPLSDWSVKVSNRHEKDLAALGLLGFLDPEMDSTVVLAKMFNI